MMKKSAMAIVSAALLGMASAGSIAHASATDPECELLGWAICSASHVEGSPAFWDCVLAFIQNNCESAASVDWAALRQLGLKTD